jgi:hypothetical protein
VMASSALSRNPSMSMPEPPPKSLRSTTGPRYPAIPGRYHGKAEEVGFEPAVSPLHLARW